MIWGNSKRFFFSIFFEPLLYLNGIEIAYKSYIYIIKREKKINKEKYTFSIFYFMYGRDGWVD